MSKKLASEIMEAMSGKDPGNAVNFARALCKAELAEKDPQKKTVVEKVKAKLKGAA